MKKYALIVIVLLFAIQINAAQPQASTRQDGILYHLYLSDDDTYAEVFDNVLNEETEVTIPDSIVYDNVTYPVTEIGAYAFNYCQYLKKLTIGNNVESIGEAACNECHNLVSLEMSNSVKSVRAFAFQRCDKLKDIVFSDSLWYMDFCAFYYCPGLTSLSFPASLEIIGKDCFENCYGLTSIMINSDLRFDQEAFKGCENLKSIYYNNEDLDSADKNIFDKEVYKTATLYVPEGCLDIAYNRIPWMYFTYIEECDFSGVEIVVSNFNSSHELIEIYNLDGIKINQSIESLQTGIYVIRNEQEVKKIVIRR